MTSEDFRRRYHDFGPFTYTNDSFTYTSKDSSRTFTVLWNEIETILAYKRDEWATDRVMLQLYLTDSFLEFDEEMLGWNVFLKRMMGEFPSINRTWESNIWVPAFETNLTLLYDKKGRSLDEVNQDFIEPER